MLVQTHAGSVVWNSSRLPPGIRHRTGAGRNGLVPSRDALRPTGQCTDFFHARPDAPSATGGNPLYSYVSCDRNLDSSRPSLHGSGSPVPQPSTVQVAGCLTSFRSRNLYVVKLHAKHAVIYCHLARRHSRLKSDSSVLYYNWGSCRPPSTPSCHHSETCLKGAVRIYARWRNASTAPKGFAASPESGTDRRLLPS